MIPRVLSSKDQMTPFTASHVQTVCVVSVKQKIHDQHQQRDLPTSKSYGLYIHILMILQTWANTSILWFFSFFLFVRKGNTSSFWNSQQFGWMDYLTRAGRCVFCTWFGSGTTLSFHWRSCSGIDYNTHGCSCCI